MNKQLMPPKGGRIETLTVSIDPKRMWEDLLRAGAPDTPARDLEPCVIWNEALMPPENIEAGRAEIILVNLGSQCEYSTAEAFGTRNHLAPVHPRHCLAIAEQYPRLHKKLGVKWCSVVRPRTFTHPEQRKELIFHVLFADDERRAQVVSMWRRVYTWEWGAFLRLPERLRLA